MATGWRNPPDADIVLRALGEKEFHGHKLILSLASPVFRDMFSVPQPPSTGSSQVPIIDVSDSPEALEVLLQTIYPTCNPLITDVGTLASVIRLADKYDARGVIDVHKDHLSSMCSNFPPIQMYAILCACGREEEAGAAARRISFASLKTLDSNPLLQLITATQDQWLVSFMAARDQRVREIVRMHQGRIQRNTHPCVDDAAHQFYSSIIVASIQAAFEANPCVQVVEGLSIVSNAPLTFSPCKYNCRYSLQGLQRYAEGLLKDLVGMAATLPWECS